MNRFIRVSAILAMILGLVSATGLAVADGPVDPPSVDDVMYPGTSIEVAKEVTTPPIPPVVDIFLLEDETGSFEDDIENLQALAPAIWDAIEAAGVDFTMGVGGFRDFAQDDWGSDGDWVYRRTQDLTTDRDAFVAGVEALEAWGGNDGPEAQLEALHYLAVPTHAAIDSNGDGDTTDANDTPAGLQPSWRADAQRIVLLATDADCHVTGDSGGWPGDTGTTDAATTAGILNGAEITVIGLVPYNLGCVNTLAADTGGSVQSTTSSGSDVKDAILAGLAELTSDVWWAATCDAGLEVTLDPAVHYDVPGDTTVDFLETITVPNDTPPGDYYCTVTFWVNEYPDEGSDIGTQEIHIEVIPWPVPLDIKPMSCPNPLRTRARGVLPVAILGADGLDVTTIDPATLRLEGVAPLRWSLRDVATPFEPWLGKADCRADCTEAGPDGYMDLTLKFDAQEVVHALGDVANRECRVLTLTGNFFDLRAIEGEDVVWIISR